MKTLPSRHHVFFVTQKKICVTKSWSNTWWAVTRDISWSLTWLIPLVLVCFFVIMLHLSVNMTNTFSKLRRQNEIFIWDHYILFFSIIPPDYKLKFNSKIMKLYSNRKQQHLEARRGRRGWETGVGGGGTATTRRDVTTAFHDTHEDSFWGSFCLWFIDRLVICKIIRKNVVILTSCLCIFFQIKLTSECCTVPFNNTKTRPIKCCSSLDSAGSAQSDWVQTRQAEVACSFTVVQALLNCGAFCFHSLALQSSFSDDKFSKLWWASDNASKAFFKVLLRSLADVVDWGAWDGLSPTEQS